MSRQIVDQYFLNFNDQLAYLELKEDKILGQGMNLKDLALPIRQMDFLDGIVSKDFEEEVNFEYFLKGMVWNLAIDPDFVYIPEYKTILTETLTRPDDYALEMGKNALKKTEEKDQGISFFDQALLAFRASYLLNPENDFACVQYAQFLWQVNQEENKQAFVEEASHLCESVLQKDEYHSYANAVLGQINEAMGKYLKAQSYYQRAMINTTEEIIVESLRSDLERISPSASVENGIYYIRRADYNKAIESLMEAKAQGDRYDVSYYLGVCYENMAKYEAAVEAFQESIDLGADFPEVYNDLTFSLSALGRNTEALVTSKRGLEKFPSDIRLRFNQAILLSELGQYDQAIEDCNFILEYADLSDEMFNQTMTLREKIKEMKNINK